MVYSVCELDNANQIFEEAEKIFTVLSESENSILPSTLRLYLLSEFAYTIEKNK